MQFQKSARTLLQSSYLFLILFVKIAFDKPKHVKHLCFYFVEKKYALVVFVHHFQSIYRQLNFSSKNVGSIL